MIGIVSMPWTRRALALVASLVCAVPGGAAAPSDCCDTTGTFNVRFTVKIDPSGHHAFIQLRDGRLVVVRLTDGRYEIRGNRPAIITAISSSPTACGFPLANGSGTVAGFPNVTGRYKDVEVAGDDIGGLLELGIGAELPGGQGICYEFTGTRDPNVPDSGAARVDYAVAFVLDLRGQRFSRLGHTVRLGGNSGIGYCRGIFVFKGDGTGGLVPAGRLPIAGGSEPLASVALFDPRANFDDIAMAYRDPFTGSIAVDVFAQTPAATFDRTQTLTLAAEYTDNNVFIAAGDLTGDGASEIVTASGSGRVDTFRYDGGAYTLSQTLNFEQSIFELFPELADLDGDGALDAALVSKPLDDQTLFVNTLLGDGAGSLAPGLSTQLPVCASTPTGPVSIQLGRLNADPLPDIVVGTVGGACPTPDAKPIVISLLNRPDQPGAFTPLPPFEVPAGSDTFQLTLFTPPCAGTPALVANGGIFVGNGAGGFTDSGVRLSFDGIAPGSVLPAHFDGDAVDDLAAFYPLGDRLTINTFSVRLPAERPTITSISVVGKNLLVEGSGFPAGSTILVDGVAYKTKADRASPSTTLFSKKALKKIPAGTPVTVQVRTPDGVVSNGTIFQR